MAEERNAVEPTSGVTCTTVSATALLGTCTIKGSVNGLPLYLKMFSTACSFSALAPSPYTVSANKLSEFASCFTLSFEVTYLSGRPHISRHGATLMLFRFRSNQLRELSPWLQPPVQNTSHARKRSRQEVSCPMSNEHCTAHTIVANPTLRCRFIDIQSTTILLNRCTSLSLHTAPSSKGVCGAQTLLLTFKACIKSTQAGIKTLQRHHRVLYGCRCRYCCCGLAERAGWRVAGAR